MNILKIIVMSIRIYTSKAAWYVLLGLLLLANMIIAFGVMSAFFLVNCLLAYYLGAHGTWVYNPIAIIAIGINTLISVLFGSYMFFGSVGAFVHTCAQVGAGKKEVSLMHHLEYMGENAASFWIIGMAQQVVAVFPMLAVVSAAILLGSIDSLIVWAGVAISVLLYLAAQYPLWLAFPAMAVKKEGAVQSLLRAMRITLKTPVSSALMLMILYVLAIAPGISLILYPVYFFFIYAPFAAVLALTYYEASEGLLK